MMISMHIRKKWEEKDPGILGENPLIMMGGQRVKKERQQAVAERIKDADDELFANSLILSATPFLFQLLLPRPPIELFHDCILIIILRYAAAYVSFFSCYIVCVLQVSYISKDITGVL